MALVMSRPLLRLFSVMRRYHDSNFDEFHFMIDY